MGDRHGGCFARRGRALNPHRPQVDAPLGESLPTRRTSKRICPHARRLPSAKASRHGARAKGFAPRRNTPLGEGLPTRRTSERICAARERSPRRKPPDTAHERKDLPRAGTLSSAKASRHGAREKGFAPRRNTPRGEGLPTRREGERICAAQEHAPRRKHPDTAHERKDLCRAGTRPSAKVSRHGARAKGFAPRRNTPLGEGRPTRREGERICPHRNTPLGESLPTRRTSEGICPAGGRVCPTCRRTAGHPRPTDSRKTPLRRGRTHSVRPLPSSFTEKNKTTP